MSNIKQSEVINEINSKLKSQYDDFRGTYFYGSRFRGDSSIYSDYDMLLVFDREIDYPFKRQIRDIIYEFMLKYDIVIDTKIFSAHEMIYPKMPFTQEVKQHGQYFAV